MVLWGCDAEERPCSCMNVLTPPPRPLPFGPVYSTSVDMNCIPFMRLCRSGVGGWFPVIHFYIFCGHELQPLYESWQIRRGWLVPRHSFLQHFCGHELHPFVRFCRSDMGGWPPVIHVYSTSVDMTCSLFVRVCRSGVGGWSPAMSWARVRMNVLPRHPLCGPVVVLWGCGAGERPCSCMNVLPPQPNPLWSCDGTVGL